MTAEYTFRIIKVNIYEFYNIPFQILKQLYSYNLFDVLNIQTT